MTNPVQQRGWISEIHLEAARAALVVLTSVVVFVPGVGVTQSAQAGVIRDTAGNLYGTTIVGAESQWSTDGTWQSLDAGTSDRATKSSRNPLLLCRTAQGGRLVESDRSSHLIGREW
jgi:hypothetical protein